MKKIGLLLLLLFTLSPLYCHQSETHIVFIPKSSDQDFWRFMRHGVDKAIAETGNIKLSWRGPRFNDDIDAQIRILDTYTQPDVDAIIIAPTDHIRLVEPVRKAVQLGIKVVVVDSALDGDYQQNSIMTDNYAAGMMAARRLSYLMQAQGNVIVFRTVAGSASTDQRAEGFIDYIKVNAPQIKIIADEYGGGSKGKLMRSAITLLEKGLQIDGIFAVNESSSFGMLRALQSTHLAGKFPVVGFDSNDFLLESLKNGEIDGLVIQDAEQMGYLSLKAAVSAVRGSPLKESNLFTETIMLTRENMDNPDIKALLVP